MNFGCHINLCFENSFNENVLLDFFVRYARQLRELPTQAP
jgi:hypothetical protein